MKQLWATKHPHAAHADAEGLSLHRTLGPWGLTALGIGAVIGGGIFVITGQAAADHAGPAIMLSFVLAAICCTFCALAYAEFAAMVQGIREVEQSLGSGDARRITQGEMMNREILAKSLVAGRAIREGEVITAEMVDVRSPGEYAGQVTHMPDYPQEGVLRGGHIPGAQSIPWAQAANPDQTFKSPDELRALYAGKGVTPEKEVVVYCRIGEQGLIVGIDLVSIILSHRFRTRGVDVEDAADLEFRVSPHRAHVDVEDVAAAHERDLHARLPSPRRMLRIRSAVVATAMLSASGMTSLSTAPRPTSVRTSSAS